MEKFYRLWFVSCRNFGHLIEFRESGRLKATFLFYSNWRKLLSLLTRGFLHEKWEENIIFLMIRLFLCLSHFFSWEMFRQNLFSFLIYDDACETFSVHQNIERQKRRIDGNRKEDMNEIFLWKLFRATFIFFLSSKCELIFRKILSSIENEFARPLITPGTWRLDKKGGISFFITQPFSSCLRLLDDTSLEIIDSRSKRNIWYA